MAAPGLRVHAVNDVPRAGDREAERQEVAAHLRGELLQLVVGELLAGLRGGADEVLHCGGLLCRFHCLAFRIPGIAGPMSDQFRRRDIAPGGVDCQTNKMTKRRTGNEIRVKRAKIYF